MVVRAALKWTRQALDLDLHFVHESSSCAPYHVGFQRHGRLDRWPFAWLDHDIREGDGVETVKLSRALPGTTFCLVHDFTHRDDPGSTALAESGAVVTLYDGEDVVVGAYKPAMVPGNLWCPFALVDGVPVAVDDTKGIQGSVGVETTREWATAGAVLRQVRTRSAMGPRVDATGGPVTTDGGDDGQPEVSPDPTEAVPGSARRFDRGFALCAAVGIVLILFMEALGLFGGAMVMIVVTVVVLYFVQQAGYPLGPVQPRSADWRRR